MSCANVRVRDADVRFVANAADGKKQSRICELFTTCSQLISSCVYLLRARKLAVWRLMLEVVKKEGMSILPSGGKTNTHIQIVSANTLTHSSSCTQ